MLSELTTLPIVHQFAQILTVRRNTLATAESCTGGYLAHMLTQVAGASAYYRGGVVAYHINSKQQLLSLPPALLKQHGEVSAPTALVMAQGIQQQLRATLGLATTGFVGPTGGTPQNPLGTVWLALVSPNNQWTRKLYLKGNREENIKQTVIQALYWGYNLLNSEHPAGC